MGAWRHAHGTTALATAFRCARSRSSGPLGVLLSPPALDVKLLTALQVLQDPPVPPCVGRKCTTTENLCVWWRHAIHSPIPPPLAPEGTLGVTWSATVGNLTSHHRPAAERGRQVRAVCCISFFTTKILCYYFLFGHFVRTCWGVCSLWCAHVHYGTRSLNKSHSELCALIMTALATPSAKLGGNTEKWDPPDGPCFHSCRA